MAPSAEDSGCRTAHLPRAGAPAQPADEGAEALAASVLQELADAWQRGQPVTAEELFERHPDIRANAVAAVRLIYEEVCLREERGETVSAEEVVRRFPHWRQELEILLDCHGLLSAPVATPDFPSVGERLGSLKLEAELGRGTQGRVFLATQSSLAGRPLVLKLTACDNHEHFSLARLQHTHIVPLYWAEDFPERHLRMLCMPYLGGTTLARLLAQLWTIPQAERSGRDLLEALSVVRCPLSVDFCNGQRATDNGQSGGPLRQLLGRTSYVQALCWLGACLADALQYAHERGLVHLDLKPSNVLLAADGTPLLLDFHLAREPLKPGSEVPEWFGGTPGYMSPEQRAAASAVGEGRPVPVAVDGRSDLYSLGLLLYESLGGGPPTSAGAWLPLDHFNPQVSPGLADIIHKCLQDDPARRYPSAALLAADLRRHLGDLPLRGVPNRSLLERWSKWRRRRPLMLPLVILLMMVLAGGAAVWVGFEGHSRQRLEEARTDLEQGERQLREGNLSGALETLKRGRALAAATPGGGELAGRFEERLRAGHRSQAARQLHETVRRLAFATAGGPLPRQQALNLEERCRSLWAQRDRLLHDKGVGLSSEEEEQLRTDLLDLVAIWVGLRRQLPVVRRLGSSVVIDLNHLTTQPPNHLTEALAVLEEAEQLFGPSPVLEQERLACAEALGLKEEAQAAARRLAGLKPRTEWERYAVGRALLTGGKLPEAAAMLERAVAAHPESFWPNFSLGIARFRQGRFDEAVHCFGVCIALAPRRAECYYNRGLALAALGKDAAALGDYDRALQLDPDLAAAAQNRGSLHHRAGRYALAEADFERARDKGLQTAAVYYGLALAQWKQHKRQPALDNLARALYLDPNHAPARALRDQIRRKTIEPRGTRGTRGKKKDKLN